LGHKIKVAALRARGKAVLAIFRRSIPALLAAPALAKAVPLFVLGTGATQTPNEQNAHAFPGRAIRTETGNDRDRQ